MRLTGKESRVHNAKKDQRKKYELHYAPKTINPLRKLKVDLQIPSSKNLITANLKTSFILKIYVNGIPFN